MADGTGLSLAVRLGELNDFLEPSQDCAVDLERPRLLRLGTLREHEQGPAATISVADCLACSGCVTSAETVLLTMHNHKSLIDLLASIREARLGAPPAAPAAPPAAPAASPPAEEAQSVPSVIISLSAVSEAALMAHQQLSTRHELYAWLYAALPQVTLVCSTDLAERLATAAARDDGAPLSSHCPGVALYAEKFEHHMIPKISTAPPVQVWQGACVKSLLRLSGSSSWYSDSYGVLEHEVAPERSIYHVMIHSCSDKKLEIIRPEFDGLVDLALTTDELLKVLEESASPTPRPQLGAHAWELCHRLGRHYGLRLALPFHPERANGVHVASELEAVDVAFVKKRGRNADHFEWAGGRLSSASGLRNMKNMLSAHKKLSYEKADLLACPQGCFSGAGHTNIYKQGDDVRARAHQIFTTVQRYTCHRLDEVRALIAAIRPGLAYQLRAVEQATASRNNW